MNLTFTTPKSAPRRPMLVRTPYQTIFFLFLATNSAAFLCIIWSMHLTNSILGGAWEWHQDYGYWYGNGCLWPNMLSVIIAIDPNTRENGCFQLLKGIWV